MPDPRWSILPLAALLHGCAPGGVSPDARSVIDRFTRPERTYAPYVRWALPGGDITPDQLTRELVEMRDRGIGGVEIVALAFGDDPDARTVGPDGHFPEMLAHVLSEGRRLGIDVELTASSGWTQGGPFIRPGTDAIQQEVLYARSDLGPMRKGDPVPDGLEIPGRVEERPSYLTLMSLVTGLGQLDLGTPRFDPSLQEFLGISAGRDEGGRFVEFVDISAHYDGDRLHWEVPRDGDWTVFTLFVNDVLAPVVGPAYVAEDGPTHVVNPIARAGVETLISELLVPWDHHFDQVKPSSYFFDSFEFNSQLFWADAFADEFEARKGYSIIPYLPAIIPRLGDSEYPYQVPFVTEELGIASAMGDRVREDYTDVRTELFIENFIRPMRDWAHGAGSELKVQPYGHVIKGDYQKVGLEIDGHDTEHLYASGAFPAQKTVSSSARMAGKKLVSCESFVQVFTLGPAISLNHHLPVDHLHLLAGRSFAAGVNRLTYHTKAYDRDGANDWWPYETFTYDLDRSEHWETLTDLNLPWTRLSYLMQQGEQAAPLGVMYTNEVGGVLGADPGRMNVVEVLRFMVAGDWPHHGESDWSIALRTAAYGYNTIEPGLFRTTELEGDVFCIRKACFEGLLIAEQELESLAVADLSAIVRIAESGFPVFMLGEKPLAARRARGFSPDPGTNDSSDAEIRDLLGRLAARLIHADSVEELADTLSRAGISRPLQPTNRDLDRLTTHYRETEDDVFVLFFNESEAHSETSFRPNDTGTMYWMDPYDGSVTPLGSPGEISVALGPFRTGVLWIDRAGRI